MGALGPFFDRIAERIVVERVVIAVIGRLEVIGRIGEMEVRSTGRIRHAEPLLNPPKRPHQSGKANRFSGKGWPEAISGLERVEIDSLLTSNTVFTVHSVL